MCMCGHQVHLWESVLFFKPFDFQGLISSFQVGTKPTCLTSHLASPYPAFFMAFT